MFFTGKPLDGSPGKEAFGCRSEVGQSKRLRMAVPPFQVGQAAHRHVNYFRIYISFLHLGNHQ